MAVSVVMGVAVSDGGCVEVGRGVVVGDRVVAEIGTSVATTLQLLITSASMKVMDAVSRRMDIYSSLSSVIWYEYVWMLTQQAGILVYQISLKIL